MALTALHGRNGNEPGYSSASTAELDERLVGTKYAVEPKY
jgi:hypothetical protein